MGTRTRMNTPEKCTAEYSEEQLKEMEKDPKVRGCLLDNPSYNKYLWKNHRWELEEDKPPDLFNVRSLDECDHDGYIPIRTEAEIKEENEKVQRDKELWAFRKEAFTILSKRKEEERKRLDDLEDELDRNGPWRLDPHVRNSSCELQYAIVKTLRKALPNSMSVKELARSIGLKPYSISGWIYNNLDCAEITRVKRGAYAYCPEPETVPTQQPASAATRETPAALPSQSQGKR